MSQCECGFEHQEENEEEHGEPEPAVGHHGIYDVRYLVCAHLVAHLIAGLGQCATNEAIFGVHYGGLAVGLDVGFDLCLCVDHGLADVGGVGERVGDVPSDLIVLEELYGEVACGVFGAYAEVGFERLLYRLDGLLDILSVVDVDVARHIAEGSIARGEILVVVLLVVLGHFAVPLLDILCHVGHYVAVLIDVVEALVHVDYDVEEGLDAFASLENGWHHRDAEQGAEGLPVEGVAA